MGKLLGIPEWLAASLFVVAGLAIWIGFGEVMHRRAMRRLAAARPSPTREEFIAMLAGEVEADTAGWLWEQALAYYFAATPHPDDRLSEDAMIDDGDWSMDWPGDFAEQHGFDPGNYPDWPVDQAVTLRNFGRWLDMGRNAPTSAIDFHCVGLSVTRATD